MSFATFSRRALALFVLVSGASVAGAAYGDPFVMGALGDSMTRGFDTGALLDHPEHSWSTGNDGIVKSHASRLAKLFGTVTSYNVAVSGAKAWMLPLQASALLVQARPDYVTILVGANDLCSWPDDDQEGLASLASGVSRAISMIVVANPAVKILLVPVPDMLQLREVGLASGCQLRWNITHFCPRLLSRSVTTQDLSGFASRLGDANATLASVAAQFPNHVRFAADVARSEFSFADVSTIDCFHPSMAGQDFLANQTWEAGWYADRD
jgi:lysophospholipase L1-like esterase